MAVTLDSASALLLCMCHAVALAHPSANQENPQLGHQRRRECGGSLPQTARGPHGGQGRGPEFRCKKKTPAAMCHLRPGSFLRGYRTAITQSDAAYQQTPWSPTLFRQSRCQGLCDQGWWCPFYGRFPQKIGVGGTAKAAALSLSRLSPNTDLATEPALKL
jgi:hypothetical protein